MRIYTKNGYLVARELPEREATTAGGIILLADTLRMSGQGHEVEVVESGTPDLKRGDRVIISVAGISAFHKFDGGDCFSIPEREVWAKVAEGGDLLPRHGQLLTQRDDAAMKRYVFGSSSVLHLPESNYAFGQSAGDIKDPTRDGARDRDCVTLLYERVVRRGPDVKDDQLAPGGLVAFSPSYCSTRLQRLTRVGTKTETRHYHLVPADEVFFAVAE
jgi:hypothetical protein